VADFLSAVTEPNLFIMVLRTIHFITFLVAAYFFGSYINQLWVAPWWKDLTGPTFVEVFKANSYYTNVRIPVITATLQLLLVAVLILKSKERATISFVFTTISFVLLLVCTLINNQVYQNYSNQILNWNVAALPGNWIQVKHQVLSYQIISGIFMTGFCLLLFTSFFFSGDFTYAPQRQNAEENAIKEESMQYPVSVEPGLSL
jgi:hypothetical protein